MNMTIPAVPASVLQLLEKGSAAQKDTSSAVPATEGFQVWPAFLNMVVMLAIVIALIILLSWLIRRFAGNRFGVGTEGFLQVMTSAPLGDRRFLSVVRAGERYFLISISPGEIQYLTELNKEDVQAGLKPQQGVDSPFAKLLRRVKGESNEAAS